MGLGVRVSVDMKLVCPSAFQARGEELFLALMHRGVQFEPPTLEAGVPEEALPLFARRYGQLLPARRASRLEDDSSCPPRTRHPPSPAFRPN